MTATVPALSENLCSQAFRRRQAESTPRSGGALLAILPKPASHLPSSIFHLPPSRLVVEFSEVSEFFSCILYTESSESFSCILFTEFSESWTAASLARMVDRVRATKNNGQTRCCLSLNRRTPHDEFKKLRPVSLIPLLRTTTSHESMVLLISKHLCGCLPGNTPFLSGCQAWLVCLNPFHRKGFHHAASRFRPFLNSPWPSLRHTLLPTLAVHPVKAS